MLMNAVNLHEILLWFTLVKQYGCDCWVKFEFLTLAARTSRENRDFISLNEWINTTEQILTLIPVFFSPLSHYFHLVFFAFFSLKKKKTFSSVCRHSPTAGLLFEITRKINNEGWLSSTDELQKSNFIVHYFRAKQVWMSVCVCVTVCVRVCACVQGLSWVFLRARAPRFSR